FFGDYQGTRQTNGVSGTFTLPTNQVRTTCNPTSNATSATPGFCDLSQYIGVAAGGGLIFDPNTGNVNNGTARLQFCGPAGCATQPNWIPMTAAAAASVGHPATSVVSPAAAAILAAMPAPGSSSVLNNFIGSGSGPFTQNSFDTRIDYA